MTKFGFLNSAWISMVLSESNLNDIEKKLYNVSTLSIFTAQIYSRPIRKVKNPLEFI